MSSFPHQVQIMLTERCNLTCRHCAVPAEDSPADAELRTAEWQRFIAVLAAAGVRDLVVSGGEALLRRDAVSLAASALDQGVERTTIVTNGMRFHRRTIDELTAAQARHPRFGLHVSIDGATADTHDWMRGDGSFIAIAEGIAALRDAGGRVTGMHSVLHRGNVHELAALAELAASIGAQTWTLFPIASVGRGRQIQRHVLDRAQWETIYRDARALGEQYALDVSPMGPILVDEWPIDAGSTVPTLRAALSSRLCVGPDGAVFTCPPLRSNELGSVPTIQDGADWLEVADRGDALVAATCPQCKFQFLCMGGRLDAGHRSYALDESPVDPSSPPLLQIGPRHD